MNDPELSQWARQLEWTSCLTSAGGVTLADRTTFLLINTGLPNQDNSWRSECHEMLILRV